MERERRTLRCIFKDVLLIVFGSNGHFYAEKCHTCFLVFFPASVHVFYCVVFMNETA